MSIPMSLYLVALFFVLTPGVLVSLPPKGSKLVVAVTHAVVFAVVYQLTNGIVSQALEGFATSPLPNGSACTKGNQCKSGRCSWSTTKCENKLPNGATCDNPGDCISMSCIINPSTRVRQCMPSMMT